MADLDGVKEIFLKTAAPASINPAVGYIFKWIEASGSDFVYKYKTSAGVVGNIGTSGAISGDISVDNITANGNITLTGTNHFLRESLGWKDNIAPFISAKLGGGGSQPEWTNVTDGLYAHTFSASVLQELWINFHINHDYEVGTNVFPHVHWMPSDTSIGTVRWGFEYSIAKGHNQSAFPASSTIFFEQETTGVIRRQFITEHATGISDTELEPDAVIMSRIFRDAAHANDTYTGTVYGVAGDLHYQSRQDMTLNKVPNFYA